MDNFCTFIPNSVHFLVDNKNIYHQQQKHNVTEVKINVHELQSVSYNLQHIS